MNRIAMIAAVVGLSAAPAFAASQSNTAPPANPPAQQQQLRHSQTQAQNSQNNSSFNQGKAGQDQKTAMNQQGGNGNGQARSSRSAYQQHRRAVANRETKALNMLEAQGFTQFTNFHRVRPGVFGASVDHHGRWMSVRINPHDNQILRG